jgi:hypothetical protein
MWLWIVALLFFAAWGLMLLSFINRPIRACILMGLRKSTYMQIYTTLTRRAVKWLWAKVCDPADDRAGLGTLFRAALTWRLYDKALIIAVAYPFLLLVGQWVVTGQDGRIGSFVLLEAAPFWWDRAIAAGCLVILTLVFVARKLASASSNRVARQAADFVPFLAMGFVFLVIWAFRDQIAGALALAFAVAAAVAVAFAAAFAFASAVAFAGIAAGTAAGAVALALAGALAGALPGAVAVIVAFTVVYLDEKDRHRAARWLVTICVLFGVLGSLLLLDFTTVSEGARSLFVFLAVLPLLNALFDTLSYAVTLTLMRRGLRAAWPVLWGLLDLALACVLFLCLGMTLVVTIHALNLLAGVPMVDLPALLAGVHTDPGAYVWLYLMLFSTILPTALHAGLSLLGVQGIWPKRLRRPVAGWVSNATASPLHALCAGLALGVIWTLPLVVIGFVIWVAWHYLGGAVIWLLSRYFDALLWLAAVPAGAV